MSRESGAGGAEFSRRRGVCNISPSRNLQVGFVILFSNRVTAMTPCFLRLTLCLAALALPFAARSACEGTDLSRNWSAATRAELDRRASAVPYPEGRFWEVTKDGESSVLFGMIHLSDDDVATPPPGLVARIETAEELLVEVTIEDEKRLIRKMIMDPGRMISDSNLRLSEVIEPEIWAQIVALTAPYGIGPEAADRLKPWYLVMTLNTPACMLGQRASDRQILDRRIEALAMQIGVPVSGLETPEELFEMFDAVPFDRQVEMLTMSIPAAAVAEDYLATTKALYRRGQIQHILEYGLMMTEAALGSEAAGGATDGFLDTLLTERNRRWVDRLLPRLAQGDRVVAVGALHLPGSDGLLARLEAEGFALRRLPDQAGAGIPR